MSTKAPLVSIGLITYNRGNILHLAIDQLLHQTYQNIELIISDNASDDNTQEVCDLYAKKDPRVRYIRQKKNIGMYNNFNFVLSQAKGEFFLWATDDDEWEPVFIERMVTLHNKYPSVVVATSNYILFSDKYREITRYQYAEFTSLPRSSQLFIYHAVLITYGLVKTSVLKKTGGFFCYPRPIPDGIGDSLVAMRILLQGEVAFDRNVLWKKRDSGYTFEKYTVLSNLEFSSAILLRIKRYMVFPILYAYNFIYMTRDILSTKYNCSKKIVLLYQVFVFFIISNMDYLCSIIKGVYALVCGLIKYIFNPRVI